VARAHDLIDSLWRSRNENRSDQGTGNDRYYSAAFEKGVRILPTERLDIMDNSNIELGIVSTLLQIVLELIKRWNSSAKRR